MKDINEYSDKELAKLHGQFKKLKTYQEKVEFVYSHFGRVYIINKYGTEFDFSIKPSDTEENRIRWMYFFERRKEETFQKLKSDHEARYEKVSDKARFIEVSLVDVRKIYESNSNLKYGYEMGSLAKGLDWMDWEPNATSYDLGETLQPYYEGLAYYELEQWLIGLKEDSGHGFDHDMVDGMMKEGLNDPKVRFVVADQLGIIEHLEKRFCHNDRRKLSDLLSYLFGSRLGSKERDPIYQWVKKYFSEDQSKSPINPTNTEKASRVLNLLGINLPKSGK
jgi:hypothetical protein